MIGLFVFDLDGTLVDSLRDLADAANALLVECGAPPLAHDAIGRMVGDGAAMLVVRTFAASGIPQPPDALNRFLALYEARLLCHTRPYEGIPETLQALASHVPLGVLTNKPLAATRRILHGLDLARYFPDDRVMGGDGPYPRKPDPTALCAIAAGAGVRPADAMLVGDSAIDWRTAHNAGTAICLVRYGFGFVGVPRDELAASDLVIDAPGELLAL